MRTLLAVVLAVLPALAAFSDTPISDPRVARGAGRQTAPASATDGHDFLLVWEDTRGGEPAIYATRVTADGRALDPEGIRISDAGRRPAVAWTGGAYVVVWQGEENIGLRRLGRDGRFVDPLVRTVFEGWYYEPRVAVSDGVILVAAIAAYAGAEIAVVNDTGAARTTSRIREWSNIELACTPAECFVATDRYDHAVAGRHVSREGAVRETEDIELATNATSPRLAASGDRFLLAWRDVATWAAPSRRVWARELGTDPLLIAEADTVLDVAASASGRDFLVAWTQHREPGIHGGPRIAIERDRPRIEMRARRVDGEEVTIATNAVAEHPAIASNGATHLGAWIERLTGYGAKIAAGVTHGPASVERVAVTRTATEQTEASAIACGDHLLVVWAEDLEGQARFSVMARRFALDGTAIDAAPVRIAESQRTQRNPVAAFDGESYLIAWSEDRGLRARGMRADGALAADVLALSDTASGEAAIAALERGFAVLHGEDPYALVLSIVRDASVTRTSLGRYFGNDHAVGWNGSEIVAVWATECVLAARVTPDGVQLGADPMVVGVTHRRVSSPVIACAADECVAAWSDFLNGANSALIAGAATHPIGEPILDLSEYRHPPADRFAEAVVRIGGRYEIIASAPAGTLYARSVRDGFASGEKRVSRPLVRGETRNAVVFAGDALYEVVARPVDGPPFAGARRLFLRKVSG
jgi:hypothetical protein